MQKSEVKDLTVGAPMKLILSFAVPMLLGFLFQQFYNMVDTIIVGNVWEYRLWRRLDRRGRSTL